MEMEQNDPLQQEVPASPVPGQEAHQKFCKHCGGRIPADAVVCTLCGRQVEEMNAAAAPNIVINNSNENTNTNLNAFVAAKAKNKWVALALCFFLGIFGAHKFYEGKVGIGILYLFTLGLFGIGVLIDFIALLLKPNPYFV